MTIKISTFSNINVIYHDWIAKYKYQTKKTVFKQITIC